MFVATETKGFPPEMCRNWVKENQQETVPKEAKDTIYSKKSVELNKVMQSVDRGALTESM